MIKKIKYINGIRFYRALVVGINNLISRQDYLNQINVFPVPEGDTGTNMAFTVNSILDGTTDIVPIKIGDMAQNVAPNMVSCLVVKISRLSSSPSKSNKTLNPSERPIQFSCKVFILVGQSISFEKSNNLSAN